MMYVLDILLDSTGKRTSLLHHCFPLRLMVCGVSMVIYVMSVRGRGTSKIVPLYTLTFFLDRVSQKPYFFVGIPMSCNHIPLTIIPYLHPQISNTIPIRLRLNSYSYDVIFIFFCVYPYAYILRLLPL